MTVMIRIDTGNAAFEENCAEEVARILRILAADIEQKGELPEQKTLYDLNGNKVGTATTLV